MRPSSQKLSLLDRFLPLWIGAGHGRRPACSGALVPGLNDGLDKLQVGTVSLPIALGLLLMMYPVLAKVRYEDLGRHAATTASATGRFFGVSLFLSWVVGPAADVRARRGLLLADQPAYRTGRDHRRARPLHRHGARSGTTSPRATASARRCSSSFNAHLPGRSPTRCSATST